MAETSKPKLAESTASWLSTMGLAESDDPNVGVLREACIALDELNAGKFDLTPQALATACRSVRATITAARKALQPLVDEANTAAVVERHELRYSAIAARTLGWIDPRMLSDDLWQLVADHLHIEHGIELHDYVPIAESV